MVTEGKVRIREIFKHAKTHMSGNISEESKYVCVSERECAEDERVRQRKRDKGKKGCWL